MLRVPRRELSESSGLAFTNKFGLHQPALSKTMDALGVQNLDGLRRSISDLGSEWWLDAMTAPRTGRAMTSFFAVAQDFRIPDREFTRSELASWTQSILEKYSKQILPGPSEVAKATGALREKAPGFWVDRSVAIAFKREFRLVPARVGEEPLCAIAIPKNDFKKEAIVSAAIDIGPYRLPAEVQTLNLIRVVWDLSFGDSRLRESRAKILEIILNEV
jgi:hypothetical protein